MKTYFKQTLTELGTACIGEEEVNSTILYSLISYCLFAPNSKQLNEPLICSQTSPNCLVQDMFYLAVSSTLLVYTGGGWDSEMSADCGQNDSARHCALWNSLKVNCKQF
jgi:hypothetical protein